ncbi:MAG: ABC transporter permease [Gammaproteobacteria bacterium]|nr:ABC transporter permease [Gammaproteobacteria bacterium]
MLRESLRSLCESPTRAAACVFSVALGVGSVVVILGLAEGTERTIRELLENREINVNAFGSLEDAPIQLSVSDAHAIQTELPSVRAIELWTRGNFKVQSEGLSQDGVVEAQTAPRPIVNDGEEWPLKAGTFLTADDHKRRAQVALLGPSLRKSLFEDDADPVGKYVQIGGVPFLVKGVLGEYPLPAGFDIPDEIKENMRFQLGQVVYVPFATALDVLDQGSATASSLSFAAIDMIVADAALVEKVASELRDLLIRRHGREGFNIEIPAKQRANTLGGLWSRPLAFLSGVAGVALLACGAGVTVIMALWVDARRDEIGIRVALGARGRDIVNQVLTEALMAAALGGLLGVLGGILIGPAVASVITPTGLPQPPLAFATWTFAAALGCALGMGLAAAAIAARRATRLDPVNALTA